MTVENTTAPRDTQSQQARSFKPYFDLERELVQTPNGVSRFEYEDNIGYCYRAKGCTVSSSALSSPTMNSHRQALEKSWLSEVVGRLSPFR